MWNIPLFEHIWHICWLCHILSLQKPLINTYTYQNKCAIYHKILRFMHFDWHFLRLKSMMILSYFLCIFNTQLIISHIWTRRTFLWQSVLFPWTTSWTLSGCSFLKYVAFYILRLFNSLPRIFDKLSNLNISDSCNVLYSNSWNAYLIIVTTATTGGSVPFSSQRTFFHREC